jgi:hypothetical protein
MFHDSRSLRKQQNHDGFKGFGRCRIGRVGNEEDCFNAKPLAYLSVVQMAGRQGRGASERARRDV